MGDEGSAYVMGALTMIIAAVFAWHVTESACQAKHNSYDCEWSQSPFTPKTPKLLEGETPNE